MDEDIRELVRVMIAERVEGGPSVQPYADVISSVLEDEFVQIISKVYQKFSSEVGQNVKNRCVLPTNHADVERIVKEVQSLVLANTKFTERLVRSLVTAAASSVSRKQITR